MAFVENLKYMGLGMLGILIVIALIIASTYIVRLIAPDKGDNNKDGE